LAKFAVDHQLTAPWWGWKAQPFHLCLAEIPMVAIGAVLGILGLGVACWLLFSLAVYALPFFVGLTAAFAALQSGSGVVLAFVVGCIAAALTLTLGRIAFAVARPTWARLAIALIYAGPAAYAGYHLMIGLTKIGTANQVWSQAFAVVGAFVIGVTAFSRMTLIDPPAVGRGVEAPPSPSFPRQDDRPRV
jgi:hypothetical protein